MTSCLDFTPSTTARTIAYGPSPTLAASGCANLEGTPILPATSDGFRCGTKTTNRTLMTACCGETTVEDHMGCFMHCAIGADRLSDVNGFVDCISTGGNANATSEDVQSVAWDSFCQGPVNSTVGTSGAFRLRTEPKSSIGLLITVLVLVFLYVPAMADCTFAIEDNSTFIRQEVPRLISGAGIGCTGPANGGPENYCANALSGGISTDNRTIDGDDASDARYDSFFEVLGRTTTPPRSFPASVSFTVRHWEPVESDSTIFTWWASWSFCLRGIANDCPNVEGPVEACGPLFHGTGDEENPVPQGVYLKESVPNEVIAPGGPGVCPRE